MGDIQELRFDCISILLYLKDSHLGSKLATTVSKIPPGSGGAKESHVCAFLALLYLYICVIYFIHICTNKTHQKY